VIYRARIVLPISGPPIEDGFVEVREGRIESVGKWNTRFQGSAAATDFGEVIVFPGFVNAHCHLDYTSMAGKLPRPRNFPDWIKSILALKAHYSYTDYAESWMRGAQQLLKTGTTSVADIEAVPELLAETLPATPLKVYSLLEMTGVKSGRSGNQILGDAIQILDSLPLRFAARTGLSPHAPYSTHADLLEATAEYALRRGCLVSSHVAESSAEFQMFAERAGPLFDWLKGQRNMEDCGGISPVAHLARHSLLATRFIAVHANYLGTHDAEFLSAERVSVAHCPRSHAYFSHAPFPFNELCDRGANICLGTDSLASVMPSSPPPELSMFEEMRAFAASHPEVSPVEILEMATVHGAKALGLSSSCGRLTHGASADLVAIPYQGNLKDAAAAVLHHSADVDFSMIDGMKVFPQSLKG
jgi:cytosine/adenosine deaminase-related metal-dependent hydrolase